MALFFSKSMINNDNSIEFGIHQLIILSAIFEPHETIITLFQVDIKFSPIGWVGRDISTLISPFLWVQWQRGEWGPISWVSGTQTLEEIEKRSHGSIQNSCENRGDIQDRKLDSSW